MTRHDPPLRSAPYEPVWTDPCPRDKKGAHRFAVISQGYDTTVALVCERCGAARPVPPRSYETANR